MGGPAPRLWAEFLSGKTGGHDPNRAAAGQGHRHNRDGDSDCDSPSCGRVPYAHLAALAGGGGPGGAADAQPALPGADHAGGARVDEAAISYELAAVPEADGDPRRRGWMYFFRLGLALAAVSALFNGLGAHLGATVLLALPADWPIIGGPLTLEGIVYGALAGLAVLAVLLVAGTFNVGADTYALLRAIPAFCRRPGWSRRLAWPTCRRR